MCGRDEATASYWLFGLLLTEGGTGEEQAAIVLRNDSGVEACLPSSEVSAQALIPVTAAPGRFGYVSDSGQGQGAGGGAKRKVLRWTHTHIHTINQLAAASRYLILAADQFVDNKETD